MPYWDELDISIKNGIAEGTPRVTVERFSLNRTYRSGAGRGKVANLPVPLGTAEPYTNFTDVNRLKAQAYLKRFGQNGVIRPDRGHAWDLLKYQYVGGSLNGSYRLGSVTRSLSDSSFQVADGLGSFGIYANSGDLEAYSAQQYAKAAPTKAVINFAQFLGELREGLPKIVLIPVNLASKKAFLRDLGGDYLNAQFGWKPFLTDLQNLGQALYSATAALQGFTKPIHRRRYKDKPTTLNTKSGTGVDLLPGEYSRIPNSVLPIAQGFMTPGSGVGGSFLVCDFLSSYKVTQKQWYEAEYVMIPKIGFNPDSFIDRLEVLMDVDITPSVLWELAPWSWLVDWAYKIGDAIASNEAATSNRLLTNYAYGMEETVVEYGLIVYNVRGRPGSGAASVNVPSVAGRGITTHKRRIRANPFGFNPVASAITSNEQWAILGALGLSKGAH